MVDARTTGCAFPPSGTTFEESETGLVDIFITIKDGTSSTKLSGLVACD